MTTEKTSAILFFIAAILFFAGSVFYFISGSGITAAMNICLGTTFMCLGAAYIKK